MASASGFEWYEAANVERLLAALPAEPATHGTPCTPDAFYPERSRIGPAAALRARLGDLAAVPGAHLAIARDRASTLAMAVRPASLETRHFARAVYRIDPPIGWGPAPGEGLLADACRHTVAQLRALGAELVLTRTPEADDTAAAAVDQCGFTAAGTLLTFGYRRGMLARPLPRRAAIQVRPLRDDDLPELLPLAARITATHLARIPGVSPDQVANFYQDWLRLAAAGQYADAVPVAVRDGRPIGFLCYRTLEELRRCTGLRVGGHGLTAVAPQAPGAIFSLIAHAFEFVEDGRYDGGEFDADATLVAYIGMLERIGLRRIRAVRNWYSA